MPNTTKKGPARKAAPARKSTSKRKPSQRLADGFDALVKRVSKGASRAKKGARKLTNKVKKHLK